MKTFNRLALLYLAAVVCYSQYSYDYSNTSLADKIEKPTKTTYTEIDNYKSNKKTYVSVSGGISIPSAPERFYDYYKTGYDISIGEEFLLYKNLFFTVTLDYINFLLDKDKYSILMNSPGYSANISGGNIGVLLLTEGIKYKINVLPDILKVFLKAEAGHYNSSKSRIKIAYSDAWDSIHGFGKSVFQFTAGGGIEIPLWAKINLTFEVRYGMDFSEDENFKFIPMKIGLLFE